MATQRDPVQQSPKDLAAPFDHKLLELILEIWDIGPVQAAKMTGYSKASLSDWKQGNQQPAWQIREVIIKAFGIDIAHSSSAKRILVIADDKKMTPDRQARFRAKKYKLRFLDTNGSLLAESNHLMETDRPPFKASPRDLSKIPVNMTDDFDTAKIYYVVTKDALYEGYAHWKDKKKTKLVLDNDQKPAPLMLPAADILGIFTDAPRLK